MKNQVIVDTGPLVALLDRREEHHEWATQCVKDIASPMFTCESVISEALFLLGRTGTSKIINILEREDVRITHSLALDRDRERVCEILETYSNLPASLADACLVHMSENHPRRKVFTLDNHFHIYRRKGDEPIPLLIPA